MIPNLSVFLLIPYLPAMSALTSVFTKGVSMIQLLIEKPGRPVCVSEDLRHDQRFSAFAYAAHATFENIPLEMTLYDDSPALLMTEGPRKKTVELDAVPTRTGMHTLCIKTALSSHRPNVAVMVGIFILSAPDNETEGGIETVKLDDFGAMKLENLTHIATRAMLAISNAQHYARQSALYMIHDTHFLEGIISKVTNYTLVASAVVVIVATAQVQFLKKLFDSRIRVRA